MPVLDLYSRRKRYAERGEPDVFVYDAVPEVLKAQVERILDDAIGRYWGRGEIGYGSSIPDNNDEGWEFVRNQLCRGKGVRSLASEREARADLIAYLFRESDVDKWLDIIEMSFWYISAALGKKSAYERQKLTIELPPTEAIAELNTRFRHAAFGYRFETNLIVRVDSELLHAELVKPALLFLEDPRFAGAREEFLSAHAGEHKDAITDANNAFESTLKAVCDLRRWAYPPGARASAIANEWPGYCTTEFGPLSLTA